MNRTAIQSGAQEPGRHFSLPRVRLLAPGLALVLSLAASGTSGQPASGPAVPVQAAEAGVIQMRKVSRLVESDALIESVQQATLSAEVQARVLSVHADAGEKVKKGQLLAILDARELTAGLGQARAQVAQAQSRALDARQQLDRSRALKEKGFISQAALDQAQAAAQAADAALDAARAGENMASVTQGHTRIVAPFDGVLSARLAEAGDLAQPGRALFTVHQPGALRAVAILPAGQLQAGSPAAWQVDSVRIPALDRVITPAASAVQVLPSADARDLAQRARVTLGDVPGAVPGMTAKVLWRMNQVDRLVVPASAVLRRGEVSLIRVLGAEGKPVLRQVRTGESFAGGWVELLSGAQAGERLATQAAPAAGK
jgi:RND family efflux transporter MFP subunit